MPVWVRTLDIKDVWDKVEKIGCRELAKTIADRLEALTPYDEPEIENRRIGLVERFREFHDDMGELDFNDFDAEMFELYEWADQSTGRLPESFGVERVCWVKTF